MNYPSEFKEFFAHCTALGFEDRPDYRYLKRIFKDLFDRAGYIDDGLYDWDLSLKPKTDGTFGLEGLKYGSPREVEAGAGQTAGNGQASGEDSHREAAANTRTDHVNAGEESYGGGEDGNDGTPKEDSGINPNGDKSGDNQSGASGGKKPSIISTIRHSLFGGSKSGPKPPEGAGAGPPPASSASSPAKSGR